MVVSPWSRAVAAVGLAVVGLAALAGPTLGQQDRDVRKTTTGGAATPPPPPQPARIGTIDMTAVFKGYTKVKVASEDFKAAVMAKQNELMQVMTQMKTESEFLAKLTPNSVDFKKREDKITQLKAESEAKREQAEREFALKETEMLATLYKEVQSMVARVAKSRGMTYVMRVSNDPLSGSDPNSAMRAIDRVVVYAGDDANDITKDVVAYLNYEYEKAGGPAPKPAAAAAATAAGTRPRGN